MWKIIWTTIFWALIVVIAWFYLKFMDQDMGQQVSNWIMSITPSEEVDETMSWEVLDPMENLMSWMLLLQQQITDWFSWLNVKLDETKTLIEDWAKPKAIVTPVVAPKQEKPDTDVPTWTWS